MLKHEKDKSDCFKLNRIIQNFEMRLITTSITIHLLLMIACAKTKSDKKIQNKIANADFANKTDAPYHVVLAARQIFLGSGTLIKPDWVLTVNFSLSELTITL